MRTRRQVIDELIGLSDELTPLGSGGLRFRDALCFSFGDASWERYSYFMKGLSERELQDITAMMWIGRGDADIEEFESLVEEAGLIPELLDYLSGKGRSLGPYLKQAIEKLEGYAAEGE